MNQNISLFISDIHLSESRPDLTAAFLNFLQVTAVYADHLYILGDLFDSWTGDDIETALTRTICQGLKKAVERGLQIYFQAGNRDFMLGQKYAQQAGMKLLPEYYVLPYVPHVLLLHGDQLCVFDKKYQRYRKLVRNPLLMTLFRHLPRAWRLRFVNKIRTTSRKRLYQEENPALTIPEAVITGVCEKYKVDTLMHGHTHCPDVHFYTKGRCRWVLSDWDQQADFIRWTPIEGFTRHIISIKEISHAE